MFPFWSITFQNRQGILDYKRPEIPRPKGHSTGDREFYRRQRALWAASYVGAMHALAPTGVCVPAGFRLA